MANRVVNRREKRAEAEAAESAGILETPQKQEPAKKKPAKKRVSRAKDTASVRKKLFWGVYSQSLKLVAKYEFNQKKAAMKKADELSKSGKALHFVQRVKEDVDEA